MFEQKLQEVVLVHYNVHLARPILLARKVANCHLPPVWHPPGLSMPVVASHRPLPEKPCPVLASNAHRVLVQLDEFE